MLVRRGLADRKRGRSVKTMPSLHSAGAGTGERAGSVSGRRDGAGIDSLLRIIGEVEVARGGMFALESRKI